MSEKERKIKIFQRKNENPPKEVANASDCGTMPQDIKARLDDALRRLNTAVDDIKEIRRFLKAA